MRILQLKTSAARGGAETLVLLMSAELARRGHHVLTVVGEPGWLVDRLHNSRLHARVSPMTSAAGVFGLPRLALLARRQKTEIILSHGARANLFGCTLSLLAGVPLVTVEHNVDSWRDYSAGRNWLDRIIGRVSRKRIAVSRAVQNKLVEKFILPASKIVIVPNGFELRLPLDPIAARRFMRQQFGLAEGDMVVVMVARFVEQKGHHILVEAMPTIAARFPTVRFLLLGEGPLLEVVRKQAQAAGIAERVLLPGAVDDVPKILAGCDLFVLSSFWEGLPVALLEAMGAGLPAVATAVGGVPEVIQPGKTGLLVSPGDSKQLADAVCALLHDKRQRADLAHAGQEYVQQHHRIEVMTDRYLEILLSCQTVANPE